MDKSDDYHLTVKLHLKTVFSPDLNLPSNRPVSLCLFLMGHRAQSRRKLPTTPLVFNDVFTFEKSYSIPSKISDIRTFLADKVMYAELVQWEDFENDENGNVKAYIIMPLADLLYPLSANAKNYKQNDEVDTVLMLKPYIDYEIPNLDEYDNDFGEEENNTSIAVHMSTRSCLTKLKKKKQNFSKKKIPKK